MKKVVLGLFVLASFEGECMKLSDCEYDMGARNSLFYRLLDVAPNSTVDEVVGRVAGGASAPGTSSASSSTPVSTGVAGDDSAFDGLRAQLDEAAAARREAMRARDEAEIKASRLKSELEVAAKERDDAKKKLTDLSTKVGQLEASSNALRTKMTKACEDEAIAKRKCDDVESELRLLYGTLETAGYSKAQKGADVVKKSDFDAAFASRQALTGKKYAADGSDLTDKDDVTAAFASRQALTAKKYAADGGDLTDKDDVTAAFASRQALTGKKYAADGSDLTDKDDVDAALGFLGMLTTGANAHLSDISYPLLRAVFASDLTLNIKDLKDSANPLSQLTTVDTDDKVRDLPNTGDQAALRANDMMKFALLRGFFNSATYANHDQADLDGVNVHCTDGDIALGSGGLDLKITN